MKLFLALVVLLVLSGCVTADQWKAFGASGTVGYTMGSGGYSPDDPCVSGGDTRFHSLTYTMQPGAYWAMQMQAEMTARKLVEEAYAARAPDPHSQATAHDFKATEGPKRCAICHKTQAEVEK